MKDCKGEELKVGDRVHYNQDNSVECADARGKAMTVTGINKFGLLEVLMDSDPFRPTCEVQRKVRKIRDDCKDFRVGDRVRTTGGEDGTVTGFDLGMVLIDLDSGERGSGPRGEWRTFYLTKLPATPQPPVPSGIYDEHQLEIARLRGQLEDLYRKMTKSDLDTDANVAYVQGARAVAVGLAIEALSSARVW